MDKDNNLKVEQIEISIENLIIPECCKEGWESCRHIAKPPKKVKRNIAI